MVAFTDLVDRLAVEYGDPEWHEYGRTRHVDGGLVEEEALRPPAAGEERPALSDGALSWGAGAVLKKSEIRFSRGQKPMYISKTDL